MIPIYVALSSLAILGLAIASQRSGIRTWLAVATLVVGSTVAVLWAVPDTDGLPKPGVPAADEAVRACVVAEPEYVYLWVGDPPISYRVDYTRELHAACDTARRAAAAGVRVSIDARQTSRPRVYRLPPRGHVKGGGS